MPIPTSPIVLSRRDLMGRALMTGAVGLGALAVAGCSTSTGASPRASSSSGGSSAGTSGGSSGGSLVARAHAYGGDPSQFGELTLPPHPIGVVVLIHGGFWRAQYGLDLDRPLAADLAARGYATWNLEYRRVGDGGGWPATLQDVATGFDHLRTLPGLPALDHVVVVGHSAGGQLATWLAGRSRLPAGALGASPALSPVAAVSQAGVLDLVGAARDSVGGTAVPDLLGGSPDQVPDRYAVASPLARVPLGVPVRCVHAQADANVPFEQSQTYVDAARAAGADATLTVVPGDHFTLIDPSSAAWAAVVDMLPALTGR